MDFIMANAFSSRFPLMLSRLVYVLFSILIVCTFANLCENRNLFRSYPDCITEMRNEQELAYVIPGFDTTFALQMEE